MIYPSYLGACAPVQIINLGTPVSFNQVSLLAVYNDCDCKYDTGDMQFAYSIDGGVCWTCWMSWDDFYAAAAGVNQDFYLRIKLAGVISNVQIDGADISYSTEFPSCFEFSYASAQASSWNPYANMETAIALQTQLSETVSSLFGVDIYYFKLSPSAKSKDITFKEYALMDVEAVKMLKLIITDGTMPSSKPEFSDFGLDFQTDWETEISKTAFATAFGDTAQPMEGDLIYVPMMKRMWMVNGAYDEKNGNLMWTSTTFKVYLVKYQEKKSVDLGDTEALVNTFVKNKYDDLFGDEEHLDSGEASTEAPRHAAYDAYPVFESDATRKYATCQYININSFDKVYYRNVLLTESQYKFSGNISAAYISYQREYCGTAATISFIIRPEALNGNYEGPVLTIGDYFGIYIKQAGLASEIYINKSPEKLSVKLDAGTIYLITARWSRETNTAELAAYIYTHNKDVPLYKLSPVYYYFDIDNPVGNASDTYSIEYIFTDKKEVRTHGFYGWISNIKLYDIYIDNMNELIQPYPNNQHLQINDTARRFVGGYGVNIK